MINEDGVFQWDDTNYTSLPRGTGTLVEGQEWYSFASKYLKIEEISILPAGSGVYQKIKQIDPSDLGELSWEQYFGRDSSGNPNKGFPTYYDLLGDSFRLGLAPTSTAVTLAKGFQVTFKRTASLFTPVSTTVADTTEPGIPSPYHPLLAYMASLLYCAKHQKDRVPFILSEITTLNEKLKRHMGKRNPDRRNVLAGKKILYI